MRWDESCLTAETCEWLIVPFFSRHMSKHTKQRKHTHLVERNADQKEGETKMQVLKAAAVVRKKKEREKRERDE